MDKLTKYGFYRLAERYSAEINPRHIRARWGGEYRTPKQGEWYLSGSVIEAYKAPNDLTTPYHIAQIVLVVEKTIVETRVIEVLER